MYNFLLVFSSMDNSADQTGQSVDRQNLRNFGHLAEQKLDTRPSLV